MEHENSNKKEIANSDLTVTNSFIHPGYQLSTDYKKLWELIQNGQRIPAWLISTHKYENPMWHLVEVKNTWGKPNDYSIGTRGIGYGGIGIEGAEAFEIFEATCQTYCLHYVCPKNCD
jgi:hypothetical protein